MMTWDSLLRWILSALVVLDGLVFILTIAVVWAVAVWYQRNGD